MFLGATGPLIERDGYREMPLRILDDTARVATVYRAADAYLHAAHSDNFPTSILEALACGCPVIATAVGGVPEQFLNLDLPMAQAGSADRTLPPAGVLVAAGDAAAMAQAVAAVLETPGLVGHLGEGARATAERLDGLDLQVERYLDLVSQSARRASTRATSSSSRVIAGEGLAVLALVIMRQIS